MKGTIVKCLEELVITKFGKDKWEKALENAGFNKLTMFLPGADIDDSQVMKAVKAVCKTLSISLEQAAEAFGDFWVNVYSQNYYYSFYKNKTAKSLLLSMDDIHVRMTKTMENAKPPRFDYEWKNDRTLIMHYKSHRGLIDFAIGLVKGVGKFYKENLKVTKLGPNMIQVVFQ